MPPHLSGPPRVCAVECESLLFTNENMRDNMKPEPLNGHKPTPGW